MKFPWNSKSRDRPFWWNWILIRLIFGPIFDGECDNHLVERGAGSNRIAVQRDKKNCLLLRGWRRLVGSFWSSWLDPGAADAPWWPSLSSPEMMMISASTHTHTHTHTHTRETWKAPLPFCWRMQSELTCLLSSLSPCDVNFVSWHPPPEKGVCRVCRVCKRVQLRYFRPLVARFSYFHFLLISPKSDLVIGPTNAPFSVKFLPLVGMCVEDCYTKSELDMLIRSRAMIFLLIVIKQIV